MPLRSASASSASSTPSPRRGPTRACAGRSSAAPTCSSRRIEQLGGPETCIQPAQRLARAVARMSALEDPEDIVRETVRSALELAGFESAMVALTNRHGSLYVHHAEGSFAVVFSDLALSELDAIANWVSLGTSSYTVARDRRARLRRPRDAARRRRRLARRVLPLTVAGQRLGILVLADRAAAPARHRARRAARAARRPGRGRPAHGRRRARAARARRARPADRPRPPRDLPRRAAQRPRGRRPRTGTPQC